MYLVPLLLTRKDAFQRKKKVGSKHPRNEKMNIAFGC